ncbi:unnamed protein product [Paramecium primaurelia]|uniref:Uncharacterized protein n=1 Tax=Paramecium primaurelia TaxID=5886 RepID=A0A8S1LF56_PARPR|nr:unnamed protein product [Paramecium primaurelia]
MKAVLILGLIIFGITAVELESGVPILLKEIKAIKTEHTEFTFLLDLELSQGGKVSEVVSLVGDLLEQMKRDQLNDDLEYAHRTTTLGLDIEWLIIVLRNLTKERQDKNNQLSELNQILVGLQQQLDALTEQLNILNGKEESLRQTRAQEAASYQARQENNSKVLAALNEIIPKLQVAVFDQEGKSLLQTEQFEIVEKIKRELGHNHPIAIMVALTTKFDVPTVKRIIDKLDHIRNAVIALMQQEDEQETQSQITFQTVLQEIAELRERFSKDFEITSQLIKKRTNDKVLLEKRLTIINRDLSLTEQLLIQTREYKEQYDAAYAVRKGKRISEIKTVQQAYDLVENHAKKHKQ